MIARLIVADSEHDANMLYATGLFVPDPFIYLAVNGVTYAVLSDLEIDRARRQASVDRVLPYSRYLSRLRKEGVREPRLADVLNCVLRELKVREVEVPADFPLGLARKLRGVRSRVVPGAFFPERSRKTALEIRKIGAALELAETGMGMAMRALLRSRIGRDGYLYRAGQKLTAETVQGVINAAIAALGGTAAHTIVAGGNQACDPHEAGHGPLRAHQTIIIDIFPRDSATGYWGDITRTVVRGRASDKIKDIYGLVRQAQDLALATLRAGVDGQEVHGAIQSLFRKHGYPTGRRRGRMQGFFHGTGHGVGLEIHESPRVSSVSSRLQAGEVVTIEPGLYYQGIGGVRLEDVAVIRERDARNLTAFPKQLEIRRPGPRAGWRGLAA